MTTLTMELPETVFSALHADPEEFTRQMRIEKVVINSSPLIVLFRSG